MPAVKAMTPEEEPFDVSFPSEAMFPSISLSDTLPKFSSGASAGPSAGAVYQQ
jgi:hypothetical protein